MSAQVPDAHAGRFDTLDAAEQYTGYSRVVLETVRTPDGREVVREIVDHDDAVAVVALTDADEVVLLRQYRQPIRGHLLEIPAGTLDVEGEEPEVAVRRELAEEAQLQATDLEHLTTFHNSAGWSTERTHLYLARGVSPAPLPEGFVLEDEEADMEIVYLDFEVAVRQARQGEIADAKTALGLLLAAERR